MKAKYKVTLILDVDYEGDVRTFLNSLDENKYSIEKIESLEKKIKCNSCLEDKEEYASGLCEECAGKMDIYLAQSDE